MPNFINASTTCPLCPKTFRQAGPFDKHLRISHPNHAAEFYDNQTIRYQSLIDSEKNDIASFPRPETDDFPSNFLLAEDTDDDLFHDFDAESQYGQLEDSQSTRHELFKNSGRPTASVQGEMDQIRDLVQNPWYPVRGVLVADV